jgi:short-subunit dehydrogenase
LQTAYKKANDQENFMTKQKPGANQTVLITGASSGIGEELAACFARDGFNLVLVARSADKLKTLATRLASEHGVKAWVAPSDLSKGGNAGLLAARMKKDRHAIDILVNCAGVLELGEFVKMPPGRHQELIDLNVSALTEMLAHFIPPMLARGHGRVLNVASIAAFQPVPSLATYAATKAFVLSLTESLAEELKDTGVKVSALCPGITATNMVSTATESSGLKLPDILVGDAAEVAAEGYKACMKGEVIKVPGIINLTGILAGRAMPKWLLRRISGALGRATINP